MGIHNEEHPADTEHVPVMRAEVLDLLAPRPGGRYIDGTLGGGGYAEVLLDAVAPGGVVLGLDADADAIERVATRLGRDRRDLILRRANFAEVGAVMAGLEWNGADGMVLDLGISSFQLNDAGRGFSFMTDGPLDMRMDHRLGVSAADLVNGLPEKELTALIRDLGEERHAKRIVRAIVKDRQERPFETTRQLASMLERVVPSSKDTRRIHPATRTFQALRMAVNMELESLKNFLRDALDLLKPGGRLCIVAFHSLEDRLVKEAFREWGKSCRCPADVPICRCEGRAFVKRLTRKALRPTPEEIERNPRSRSARLRAVEKI